MHSVTVKKILKTKAFSDNRLLLDGLKDKVTVLDLFAGAGGFSEGFVEAGCEMVAHIEMDKDACSTIRTRMVYHKLKEIGQIQDYKKYLVGKVSMEDLVEKHSLEKEYASVIQAKIDSSNYQELIASVKKKLAGESLDIVIGGPPCQAYSNIGRSSDPKRMVGDERKYLYIYYVEFLKALKPKLFIFENVPGLLSSGKGLYLRKMRKLMKEVGYETEYTVLNTADFGVPQERKRVILIGWRPDSGIDEYPTFRKVDRDYGVSDFLFDLPPIKAGEGSNISKFKSKSKLLRDLKIVNPDIDLALGHISRPQTDRDLEIYREAVLRKGNGINLKYNDLPKRLKTHKNETGFLDRFKVVDGSKKSSHTVIAHISKDGALLYPSRY